jgi:uncharacterized protein YdhG (YjbR/CyaY superfamily)
MTMKSQTAPENIDAYIAACPPDVRSILERIRMLVRTTAPGAEEKISYRMPAFFLNGVIIYCAAFKQHIGVFPPIRGDKKLDQALAKYRGPKGNLKFPLDEPFPYTLLRRLVKFRLKELTEKQRAKEKRR